MRSMRREFGFRDRGPLLKVHRGQCLTSMTKHDSSGSPPGGCVCAYAMMYVDAYMCFCGMRATVFVCAIVYVCACPYA